MNPASEMFRQRKRPYYWLLLHIGFWVSTLKQKACGDFLSLPLLAQSEAGPHASLVMAHMTPELHAACIQDYPLLHSDSRAQTQSPECSSVLGVQEALGNRAPLADIPAQLAVLIWQRPQVPDEGSCIKAMAMSITHLHTLRRKPEAKSNTHPCSSVGPQKERWEWRGAPGHWLWFWGG